MILGTAQLAAAYGALRVSDEDPGWEHASRVLRAAEAVGVSTLDTAPAYGDAEAVIGRFATRFRVHTKVDPLLGPRDSLTRSLGRLRRSSVDVLYLHDVAAIRDSDVVRQVVALRGHGCAQVGVSVYDEDEFEAAIGEVGIDVVQVPLNVFDRRFAGERLGRAKRAGKTVYARSALLQGVLVTPPSSLVRGTEPLGAAVTEFHRLARSRNRTPLQFALGWVAAQDGVDGVIVGVREANELTEIVSSLRPLAREDVELIERLRCPDRRLSDPRNWSPT
ncbi:MAG: aldo/keto reductase [Dehalococcoidia bacterium]|nr:aldo/keto reductase [Dehalococcoidia bacterium]